jgi:molybdate transport system ATP-binding protein
LHALVEHRFSREFTLRAELTLRPGWNVLFGPSGAGKTSLLRAGAGLLRPERGRVQLGEATWFDSRSGVFVKPEMRPIGYLAQAPSLFPHLTVEQNVRFSHQYNAATVDVGKLMQRMRCEQLASRSVATLSGGEQQRVALARALARSPQVLLLDEPFRGLDLELRDSILADLQAWLAGRTIPVLAVSHDPLEVLALGAHVFRIADGAIVESGPAETVLAAERLRMIEQLGGP